MIKSKYSFGADFRTWLVLAASVLTLHFGWDSWTIQKHLRTKEVVVSEYLLIGGLSLLILSLINRFQDRIPKIEVSSRIIDTPASIGLFLSIWFLGLRHFGGYDHSALIESGWIQFSSLRPFRDYPCTIPPLFFIGDKYALLLFGVRWSAFVLMMACFATLSYLFLSWQLRALGFTATNAAGLAIVAQLGTTVVCSYWWYNPVSSLVGIMVFLSALACLENPRKESNWGILGLLFALLILVKPNTWPVGVCVLILYCARESAERLRTLGAFGSGVVLAATVCWLHGLSPSNILRTYSQVSEARGSPFSLQVFSDVLPVEKQIQLWSIGVLVSLFLALLLSRKSEFREYWREYCCCLAAALTSLGMVFTDYEIKTSDLMQMVFALAVVAFRPWSKRAFDPFGRIAVVIVATFFVVASSYWGVTRLRVRGIGEETFFQDVQTQTIRDGFFAGLHSGPRLITVMDQISDALSHYPSAKVFFGPRLEFSYAAFHHSPPAGLPIWWHAGTSFTEHDFRSILVSFDQDNFDVLIFLKGDYTRMPLYLVMYKDQLYDEIPGYSELGVYVRKKPF